MLLKNLSYYQTGGTCSQFFEPQSIEELTDTVHHINRNKIPYFLLGAGSNSLVMDENWPGAVVCFRNLNRISFDPFRVVAEAGVENSNFANFCLNASLDGSSWMYHMPGQLGPTIRMNARCYSGEISQIVNSVTVVTQEGKTRTYLGKEVFLGYKDTLFMRNTDIVVSAEFVLKKGDPEKIKRHMDACKSDRENKCQFLYPSCGCVFKNNYEIGIPSGLLLEEADVRQFNSDRVEISPYHANFVFNKDATACQILETTLNMREAVYQKFGVWLEYEMELLGIVPNDLKERFLEKRRENFNRTDLFSLRERFLRKLADI